MHFRLSFILFSFIAIFFLSCGGNIATVHPIKENITSTVYASGVIKAKNQYQVFSTVSGLISKIWVTEGDVIKKGMPLMNILNETALLNTENAKIAADFSAVNANADKLNELKINIIQAKNKMDNDLNLLQKQQYLWDKNIGTKNDLEQRKLIYKNSSENYQQAILGYNVLQRSINFSAKQSKKNLEISHSITKDFNVTADADGKVYSLLKKQGEMVNPLSPVAIIGDANSFHLELQVDEYDIAKIKIGQQLFIIMDSYKGQVFEAKISKINPLMNEHTKSFLVEAEFITQPSALYPNLTAEANIIIEIKQNALTIPRNYLINDSMVLVEKKRRKFVQTGLKDYEKVEIINGLTTNDVIYKPQ